MPLGPVMASTARSEDVMLMSNIPLSRRSETRYLFGHKPRDGEIPTSGDEVDCGISQRKVWISKDLEQEEPKFGKLEVVFGLLTIGFYVFDVGTDIWMAAKYFIGGQLLHGSVTVALIVLPSLVICYLGLTWYDQERKAPDDVEHASDPCVLGQGRESVTPAYLWPIRIIVTLLQFGMILRICEYLKRVFKLIEANRKVEEEEKQGNIKEEVEEKKEEKKEISNCVRRRAMFQYVDVCLLQLFESFLESVPQLIWQLYMWITLKPEEDVLGLTLRAMGVLSSWLSAAMTLTFYQRSVRRSRSRFGVKPMKLKSIPIYFLWRASELGMRVLCISLFATSFHAVVSVPIGIHWFLMSVWLMCQEARFYKDSPRLDKLFDVICGFAMTFCFLIIKRGHSRGRALLFYTIFYVENAAMLTVWFLYPTNVGEWFHTGGFVTVLVFAFTNILFLWLYYTCFHPSDGGISYRLQWKEYILHDLVC